jgi:hypothetical protein
VNKPFLRLSDGEETQKYGMSPGFMPKQLETKTEPFEIYTYEELNFKVLGCTW